MVVILVLKCVCVEVLLACRFYFFGGSNTDMRLGLAFKFFIAWCRRNNKSTSLAEFDLTRTFKCSSLRGRIGGDMAKAICTSWLGWWLGSGVGAHSCKAASFSKWRWQSV